MWWGGRGGGDDPREGRDLQAARNTESEYARLAAQQEAQWKQDVTSQLRDIGAKVLELALTLQTLSAGMMTRKEIEEADNRRVSTDTYTADMKSIGERLARLEGSAARILPWVALAISSLIAIIGTVISVVSLWHTLAK